MTLLQVYEDQDQADEALPSWRSLLRDVYLTSGYAVLVQAVPGSESFGVYLCAS